MISTACVRHDGVRRGRRLLPLAVALGVWLAPAASSAQPADPLDVPSGNVRLTLDDAVERAVAASYRVAEFASREEAARAALAVRTAAKLPVVGALAGYTRTNHVDEFGIPGSPGTPPRIIYPDVPDNWRARLDLQWPVYTSGRVAALERAASADVGAAGRDVAVAEADARLDAARAFWTLATAIEAVRVVERALDLVDAHLHDVRTRREVGLLAPNDVLMVEAQRSRQRVLLIEAQNAREVAEADLRRAAGLPPGTAIAIAADLGTPAATTPSFESLLRAARASRPERQALELRIAAFTDRRAAAGAALKPTVALGAGVDYARPNPRIFPRAGDWNESWDVSVNVSWSFWDGGRTKAEMAEVAALQRALEQRLADFDRTLDFEVRQRHLDLVAARAAIGAATDGVRSATEAVRVVTDRFKAGLVANTEVLEAQVALIDAELTRTRSAAGAHLALARLERVVGGPLQP
ncbi:MAG: TolC family protein [Acidobacteria bacterium]|nr:TolC family protein [Acidobacteriota bacterium]